MEDLFAKGRVPEDEPLITLERGIPLKDLVAECGGTSWAFSEEGEAIALEEEIPKIRGDIVAVLGGFPHGTFRSPVRDICARVVSMHAGPLKAWTVASVVLVAYRHFGSK